MDKHVKNFVEKKIVTMTDESTNRPNKGEEIIIRLPYISDITKRLVKQVNKTVQDTEINKIVRGVFKGEQKINNYFKWKDKTQDIYNQKLYTQWIVWTVRQNMLGKQLNILMREFINTEWWKMVNMDWLNRISQNMHKD